METTNRPGKFLPKQAFGELMKLIAEHGAVQNDLCTTGIVNMSETISKLRMQNNGTTNYLQLLQLGMSAHDGTNR